jgi:hypothetical protein
LSRQTFGASEMALAAVILGLHVLSAQELAPKPIDDSEAYAVYASLLPQEWTVRVAQAKRLVFQQEAGTNRQCMPSGKPLETEWRLVVESFNAENAIARTVRSGFPLGVAYVVVPSAEIKSAFQEVPNDPMFGWTGFYKRYPESAGIMTVSAVGFDPQRRRALVYMAHSCGLLCGGGAHHLLEKVDGVWREATVPGISNCVWAS